MFKVKTNLYYRALVVVLLLFGFGSGFGNLLAFIFGGQEYTLVWFLVGFIVSSPFIVFSVYLFLNIWYEITFSNELVKITIPFKEIELTYEDLKNCDLNDNRQIFIKNNKELKITLLPTDLIRLRKYYPFYYSTSEFCLPYKLKLNITLNIFLLATAIVISLATIFIISYNFQPDSGDQKLIYLCACTIALCVVLANRFLLLSEIHFDKNMVTISSYLRTSVYANPIFQNLQIITESHVSLDSGKTEYNKLIFTLENKQYQITNINTNVSLFHLEKFILQNYNVI